MAWSSPTLDQLVERITNDIEYRLTSVTARLPKSVERVLAIVAAGCFRGLYKAVDWIKKQVVWDTADTVYLERWAGMFGIERLAAVASTGTATATGTSGTVIPDQTVWQRADGVRYVQDGAETITAGQATVSLVAEEGGSDGDCSSGTVVSLTSPIAGVDTDATVDVDGMDGGTDAETDSELRTRFLERVRTPPKGGGEGDYVAWAKEIAGVTRAWEYGGGDYAGFGTVGVAFVRDNDGAGAAIIPDAGEIATVQAHIEALCPIEANVTVFAPTATALNFTIAVVPNTAAVKAAVEAELEDMLQRDAEPGCTIYVSRIREAISRAEGETSHTLTVPATDQTYGTFEIPYMGTVSWS